MHNVCSTQCNVRLQKGQRGAHHAVDRRGQQVWQRAHHDGRGRDPEPHPVAQEVKWLDGSASDGTASRGCG